MIEDLAGERTVQAIIDDVPRHIPTRVLADHPSDQRDAVGAHTAARFSDQANVEISEDIFQSAMNRLTERFNRWGVGAIRSGETATDIQHFQFDAVVSAAIPDFANAAEGRAIIIWVQALRTNMERDPRTRMP